MIRSRYVLLAASSLVLAGLNVQSIADSAPAGGQTCLAEAQQLEATVNQYPDSPQKTKVLKRLHKAEKAAETDPDSSDCRHYLERAKAGLGID